MVKENESCPFEEEQKKKKEKAILKVVDIKENFKRRKNFSIAIDDEQDE